MAETILTWQSYLYAILGGILPSLVWLWFWLRQDRESPEPKGLIAISFFAGMAVVYFVLPLQKLVAASISPIMDTVGALAEQFAIVPPTEQETKITLWAFIEEVAKYATVFLIAYKSKFFDEPMDAIMYLITAALGFAAMENILYIVKDLAHGGVMEVFGNGNMRFIGATIVHIVSSAFIGIAMAFAFNTPKYIKFIMVGLGILIATLLHAYFNLSIMENDGTLKTLLVFSQFWAAIVGIIVMIAVIKRFSTKTNRIY
ncbi:MAG: PrsW family intramembrane metalloprotease [Candidatus Pacebacteria bacterium]|jgi:RsiW-degrading membrane proteinase PrsW (M82 family)|nr:PrsW family intramembrane metalloprotease [Candidatus Paceibacterota bacterium]